MAIDAVAWKWDVPSYSFRRLHLCNPLKCWDFRTALDLSAETAFAPSVPILGANIEVANNFVSCAHLAQKEQIFPLLKRRSVNAPEFRNSAGTDLDALAVARTPESMNVPGFDFHPLHDKPKRYSVHANGPWCITFEWRGENALRVDLENYH